MLEGRTKFPLNGFAGVTARVGVTAEVGLGRKTPPGAVLEGGGTTTVRLVDEPLDFGLVAPIGVRRLEEKGEEEETVGGARLGVAEDLAVPIGTARGMLGEEEEEIARGEVEDEVGG